MVVAFFSSNYEPGVWYASLQKPSFNPPNWIFAPVWAVLYLMIALAGWRIWLKKGMTGDGRQLQLLYFGQLALNGFWSMLFFGFQLPALAFVEIVILWFLVLEATKQFWNVDKLAGALFIPYLCWIGFAALLNFSLWQMN